MRKSISSERGSSENFGSVPAVFPAAAHTFTCLYCDVLITKQRRWQRLILIKINCACKLFTHTIISHITVRALHCDLLGGQGKHLIHHDICSGSLNLLTEASYRILISFQNVLKSCSGTVAQHRIESSSQTMLLFIAPSHRLNWEEELVFLCSAN